MRPRKPVMAVSTRVCISAALLVAGAWSLLRSVGPSCMVDSRATNSLDSSAYACGLQSWCPMPKPASGAPATELDWQFPVPPFPANFWFVKTVTTASDTLSGVFNTICSSYGIQWLNHDLTRLVIGFHKPNATQVKLVQEKLQNYTDVEFLAITSHMVYDQQVADALQPKFLFTVVTHPLERVRSHYVAAACGAAAKAKGWDRELPHRQQQLVGPNACDLDPEFRRVSLENDTEEEQLAFARSAQAADHSYHYIRGSKTTVQDALAQYDFVFVAERMDEALVLFMLKYGLTVEDIAYLPNDEQPDMVTPNMSQKVTSVIMQTNRNDLRLWQIANTKLDRERAALELSGCKAQVDNAVAAFEALLVEIHRECSDYQAWYHRHGFEGRYSYTGLPEVAFDSGTGYRCVRHVARRGSLTCQTPQPRAAGA